MSDKVRQNIIKIMRVFTIAMIAIGVVLIVLEMKNITIDNILNYTPENKLFAALFIVVFYVMESFTVIFPVVVLQLVTGVIFKPIVAVLVNLIGLSCSSITQFFVGRFAGSDYVDRLCKKYPAAARLQSMKNGNELFGTYMTRILFIIPMDLVSLFWGSLAIDFKKFFIGSVLGLLPGIIAVSLMGNSIRDPGSPQFVLSAVAYVVIFIISLIVYKRINARKSDRAQRQE